MIDSNSGFNAMGKPIPRSRLLAARDLVNRILKDQYFNTKLFVADVADCLESDNPAEAMSIATTKLDITGGYMLLSTLLTDSPESVNM